MKPRTPIQQEVARLSERLPKLTATQRAYAFRHCFKHYAIKRADGTNICTECGHSWRSEHNLADTVCGCTCPHCGENYELKSASGNHAPKRITTGEYHTLLRRLHAEDAPNFLVLSYRAPDYAVQQLLLIPRHYLTADMIRARKPLSDTARRQGWTGSTIDLSTLPASGKIALIEQMQPADPHRVRQQWLANRYLHGMGRQKTWLIATLRCLEQLPQTFTLADLYRFVPQLARTYPANHNIEAKLRQQLQTLRDQGKITFLTRGHYRQNP